MSVEASLHAELKAIGATVTPSARVLPLGASVKGDESDPLIVWSQDGSAHERTLRGGAGLVALSLALDVYSRQRSRVTALVRALRERLDNLTGTIGAPAEALDINVIFVGGIDYIYEPDGSGNAAGWHRARMALTMWVAESETPIP